MCYEEMEKSFNLVRYGEPYYSEANTKTYHDIGIELSPLAETRDDT